MVPHLLRVLLACACGWVLVLAFPKSNWGILSWFALSPLLAMLPGRGPRAGFFLFYACGLVFFPGHFRWILEIGNYTFLHHLLLDVYLGFYFAAFGGLAGLIASRLGAAVGLAAAPFVWVALEFARANFFFLELPWGLLAHSQYRFPLVLQIASLTGLYGVSFLVMLANAALGFLIRSAAGAFRPQEGSARPRRGLPAGALPVVAAAAVGVAAALGYGALKIQGPPEGKPLKLSLIQGNIPQDRKWDKKYAEAIMDVFAELTREAAADGPELIIWPETATPGAINLDRGVASRMGGLLREIGIPLLFGSSQQGKFETGGNRKLAYQNSAFLFHPNPRPGLNMRYDKMRLFPFGEYLPYKHLIPWSAIGVPDVPGYVPGDRYVIFDLGGRRFGVTICWENLFPGQVRQFVRNGAQFIVNMTNEAWFGETEAPEQFLSMNVFRAVENGVFLVRCANTGISCIIDPCGRVVDRVRDEAGRDVFVRGHLTGEVTPLQSNTLYTRYGDWFAWLCVIVSAGTLSLALRKNRLSDR
jgi:apolipoprotein N-acyltransferase